MSSNVTNIVEETDAPSKIRTFVQTHKTKFAVATTAVACLAINRLSHKHKDEFLKEHDLYDLYYTPENEDLTMEEYYARQS